MQEQMIEAITEWIEANLSLQITPNDIVIYSGYSRRYIYNLFNNYVNLSPGKYIKYRRLSQAAIRLRLTSESITKIACSLCFDSIQSFSREFKKLFGISPRHYRHSNEWDMSNLYAPLKLNQSSLPRFKLVTREAVSFSGCELEYSEKVSFHLLRSRRLKLDIIIKNINFYHSDIYLLSDASPSTNNEDKMVIHLLAGIKKEADSTVPMARELHIPVGLYANFSFSGTWESYADIPNRIYFEELPRHKLKRAPGHDIEHILYTGEIHHSEGYQFNIEYYVPVSL
ncbi:Right origin-binding protein [Edwardsiella tarda]|nr:Right origin-binding protein [Edwardsiella tarda]